MSVPQRIFVSGIGTGVGKTLVSAILAEALEADYWKPVQAGMEGETDSEWVRDRLTNRKSVIHPESYSLKMPASPHLAARAEGLEISLQAIAGQIPADNRNLIIEGAGGLMVPLNSTQFVTDLIKALDVKLILVSRNYLGSINHSLLSAAVCRQQNIPVLGWIFNDRYLDYEDEIVRWSGYPRLHSIPFQEKPGKVFIQEQASLLKGVLIDLQC